MKYIPGLDGLRAIAVLAVVAYHAGLPVPAGFVGVDVFFVISGYLITRLLHEELQGSGRIDFTAFYARRARRILPALTLVVLITLVAAVELLPTAEQRQAMRSGAAAFLFAANVFFQAAPPGYFDPAAEQQPLLHLWSLGVEEQFYLVWPLVLMLARGRPVILLGAVALASFALAELVNGSAAFYSMPARAWELALGGLVALRPLPIPRGSSWIGVATVLIACMLPIAHFPGIGALPAVVGSALLIAAIQNGERSALLESKPMVGIGLISYSLYLWHWPALVLGRRMEIEPLALVVLAFVLALASYRYVEMPVRRRSWHPRWIVGAGLTVIVCGGTAAAIQAHQLGKRMSSIAAGPSIYSMDCDDWFRSAKVKPCVFGPQNATHTAVVMGDSVGLQWFPAWIAIFDRPGWKIVVLTKSSCPMVDQPFYYDRLKREYTECAQWRKASLARVSAMHPDILILGSTYNYGFTPAEWTAGTSRVLQAVHGTVRRIAIVRATPLPSINPSQDPRVEAQVFQSITAAVSQFGNVSTIDMNDRVCPKGICRLAADGCTFFRDETHITSTFARSLAPTLAIRLGVPYEGTTQACSW